MPMIAFIGVRISWLMLERKSDLATLARSASIRASSSATLESRNSRCTAYSSVTSRNTSTAPTTCPSRSRIGAQLSAIGHSVPSRAMSTVWLASPWSVPWASVSATGTREGSRVS